MQDIYAKLNLNYDNLEIDKIKKLVGYFNDYNISIEKDLIDWFLVKPRSVQYSMKCLEILFNIVDNFTRDEYKSKMVMNLLNLFDSTEVLTDKNLFLDSFSKLSNIDWKVLYTFNNNSEIIFNAFYAPEKFEALNYVLSLGVDPALYAVSYSVFPKESFEVLVKVFYDKEENSEMKKHIFSELIQNFTFFGGGMKYYDSWKTNLKNNDLSEKTTENNQQRTVISMLIPLKWIEYSDLDSSFAEAFKEKLIDYIIRYPNFFYNTELKNFEIVANTIQGISLYEDLPWVKYSVINYYDLSTIGNDYSDKIPSCYTFITIFDNLFLSCVDGKSLVDEKGSEFSDKENFVHKLTLDLLTKDYKELFNYDLLDIDLSVLKIIFCRFEEMIKNKDKLNEEELIVIFKQLLTDVLNYFNDNDKFYKRILQIKASYQRELDNL